jgi:hypothetical protein
MNLKISDIVAIATVVIGGLTLVNVILYNYLLQPAISKQLKQFESTLKETERLKQERWILKRIACLKALDIADAMLSNYKYPNVKEADIVKVSVSTQEVRKCFNELACTCDTPEVIELLKTILYGSVTPDIIVDLRRAVRKELEFGVVAVDSDREKAFVGKVGCDPALRK